MVRLIRWILFCVVLCYVLHVVLCTMYYRYVLYPKGYWLLFLLLTLVLYCDWSVLSVSQVRPKYLLQNCTKDQPAKRRSMLVLTVTVLATS